MQAYRALPVVLVALLGCATKPEPDERGEQVNYRTGTEDDGYTSNGERGNVSITEINWGGSVRSVDGRHVHDREDIFIEFHNRNFRPIHLTGWLIEIETGENFDGRYVREGHDRSRVQFVFPLRENREQVDPNDYVVVAKKRDGAFRNADYYIPELKLPQGPFSITLRDLDERLQDGAGDNRKPPFAGGWDGVTVRSMERIQLIFSNRGNRDNAWHSYSLNDFDDGEREQGWHRDLRSLIHEDYRQRTFATPGRANSPDYSGNINSGSFE